MRARNIYPGALPSKLMLALPQQLGYAGINSDGPYTVHYSFSGVSTEHAHARQAQQKSSIDVHAGRPAHSQFHHPSKQNIANYSYVKDHPTLPSPF